MEIMSLETLKDTQTDMFTTVFIGNSSTRKIGDYMVTPRGYLSLIHIFRIHWSGESPVAVQ